MGINNRIINVLSDANGTYLEVENINQPGRIFLIDTIDKNLLDKASWSFDSGSRRDGYIVSKYDGKKHQLHREILKAPSSVIVDHIDRNRANCRRNNLREGNQRMNSQNIDSSKHTSKFKGVCVNKQKQNISYTVSIKTKKYLLTQDEFLAAVIYDYLVLCSGDFNTNLHLGLYTQEELFQRFEINNPLELTISKLNGKVKITHNLRRLLPQ